MLEMNSFIAVNLCSSAIKPTYNCCLQLSLIVTNVGDFVINIMWTENNLSTLRRL